MFMATYPHPVNNFRSDEQKEEEEAYSMLYDNNKYVIMSATVAFTLAGPCFVALFFAVARLSHINLLATFTHWLPSTSCRCGLVLFVDYKFY